MPEALERGAAGALVARPIPVPLPQVVVSDTLAALTAFAAAWRGDFDGHGRGSPHFGFVGNAGLAGTAAGDYCDAGQGQDGELWIDSFHRRFSSRCCLVL